MAQLVELERLSLFLSGPGRRSARRARVFEMDQCRPKSQFLKTRLVARLPSKRSGRIGKQSGRAWENVLRRGIGEKRSIHVNFQGMSTFSRASGRRPQGCRPPTPRAPENVAQNLSRSARLTMVMAARNGEAKADIAAKNLECLNEDIKIQGAAPKFATPNVGPRPCGPCSCASNIRRPEGRRRSRTRPPPAKGR
jgi:hypothetical protein